MVLVYSEKENITYELLNKGRELADKLDKKLIAVVIDENKDIAKDLIAYGADDIVIIKPPVSSFKAEEYADILRQIIEEKKIETIIIGSTKNGKELASRLSGLLKTGCIIDAVDLSLEDNKLNVKRIIYSGNAVALQRFNSKPAIVTIPPRLIDPLPRDDKRKGEIEEKEYKVKPSNSSIIKITEMKTDSVNVEEADIIVSCGRGFKNKDDLKLAEELAEALKSKTIGCSRPIAADLKWLSEDHWIGLSGHKVKPKLYVAVGISGQIQHIAGMRDSGIIVAINKDPDALIFKSADYGIVGDLYTVLPKLTEVIKEKLS